MRTRSSPFSSPRSSLRLLAVVLSSATAWTQATSRQSVAAGGTQGDAASIAPALSADGRYVVFQSDSTNLVPGDTNGVTDIFVRNRQTGAIERVSVDSNAAQGNGLSGFATLSADGRYVVFFSDASNLVVGDTNGVRDIFVHDRLSGTTERVNVATGGAQANQVSSYGAISADGRVVAFASSASNLVAGDTNATGDVFLRDLGAGTTVRVSVGPGGVEANNYSGSPAISADGHLVAFLSVASNLVPGDTNSGSDVFVRDLQSATTERVSVTSGGSQVYAGGAYPSISADGTYVTFISAAPDLVAGDTNGVLDVFLRNRVAGTTERVSVATGGAEGNDTSGFAAISADGRYVVFQSNATNLVPGDTNGSYDVFRRDWVSGVTERVSVDSVGDEGNSASGSYGISISSGGRIVAFDSFASNLVSSDTNTFSDAFVRDLDGTSAITLCDPGAGGVIACPCANPPSGPGRGCDNSSATGGASLTTAGVAHLSADSLSFTTSGQRPTGSSIFFQGDAFLASGAAYGQGVRCAGGTLRKLFSKAASGGSITVPGSGEPTVSARSAARGSTIGAGQSRWYVVAYRDPIVLGGCPAGSGFNTTPTVQVSWSP